MEFVTEVQFLVNVHDRKFVMQEAKVFKELVQTDTAKGLVHAFFAQRMTAKVILFLIFS